MFPEPMWQYCSISALIFSILSLSSASNGLGTVEGRSLPDLCSIIDGRTAIVDNRLFILSANYTFDDGRGSNQAPHLYSIDLNTTFPVNNFIPQSQLKTFPSPSDDLLGISDGAGTFFYDHESLFAYAGIISSEVNSFTNGLWAFNTTTNAWSLNHIQGGNIQFNNNSEGEHASVPATGQSFYTGGFGIGINRTFAGIVDFEAYHTPSPSWALQTQGPSGIAPPSVLKGGMAYIRRGNAGLLVVFGGFDTSHTGVEFAAGGGWDWDYWEMDQIFVYDIFSNSWFNVTATGDVPSHRGEFCLGVSAAPDDSSFQITIYGGWDQLAGKAFSDVYVLSVPSFRWIHVEDRDNPDNPNAQPNAGTVGRTRAKCDMWQDSQMIVTGGLVSDDSGHLNLEQCNQAYFPLKVLDTSTYEWQTEFVPEKEYSVPGVVSDVVGGDSTGSATLATPSGGWPDPDLGVIVQQHVSRDTYTPPNGTSASPLATPSPSAQPGSQPGAASPPASKHLSTGALVGIVIGGIAGLLALILLAVVCLHRRKRSVPASQATDVSHTSPEMYRSELATGKPRFELTRKPRAHGELDDRAARPHELGSRSRFELSGEGR